MALESVCGVDKLTYYVDESCEIHTYLQAKSAILSCALRNPFAIAKSFTDMLHPRTPKLFHKIQSESHKTGIHIDYDEGTTTLGFRYNGGIVLTVDSRSTSGRRIGSQVVQKVIAVTPNILGTLAGGAADCVYWDRVLTKECRLYELRNGRPISVAGASKIMANMMQINKHVNIKMGMMMAGYDHNEPSLFYLDAKGYRISGSVFCVGSGSYYAYGVIDNGFRYNMSPDEAVKLGERAIYHATLRDLFTGGFVRSYHISTDGWHNVSNTDCKDLHCRYYDIEMNLRPPPIIQPVEESKRCRAEAPKKKKKNKRKCRK